MNKNTRKRSLFAFKQELIPYLTNTCDLLPLTILFASKQATLSFETTWFYLLDER
jgi:hypothetical protein